MPEDKKPAAAKVAQPKKKPKAAQQRAAVEKRVSETVAPKKSVLKEPYNHRVRSLARSIVDAVEGEDDKREARAGLKGLTTLDEIREFALKNIVDNQKQWDEFLSAWFAAGVIAEK